MILAHVITRHMRGVVRSYVQRLELAGMILPDMEFVGTGEMKKRVSTVS
jgi:hypothetical protein